MQNFCRPVFGTDVGKTAFVRSRQYLIEDVQESPTGSLVRLTCLEDDAQGQELEVFWDLEIDAHILEAENWQGLTQKPFDDPKLFSAYFHALKWNCVSATDPRIFHSPFRAGIELHAYQLEPLRKALLLPRVNLFIADDVGLGKTIEAGLIVRELLARRRIQEIVVCCPPSVSLQWQEEMSERFGLNFEIVDMAYLSRIRQERGHGVNPWRTHSRFILSHALLRDENYSAPMREWLGNLKPGTLFILDEAHHAAPAGSSRYAIDSQFTRAVRDISHRFEHRLFLSATPHNGHSNSFSALLEILDPQRFTRGVPIKGKKALEAVMVRRLKEDLRIREGGFPERVIVRETLEDLPLDAPDLALPRLLDQYADALEARLEAVHAGDGQRLALKLMLGGLQQRLLSSPEAFAKTLQVHRHTLDKRKSRAANLAEAITSSEEPGEETEWDEGEVDSQISEVNLPDLQLEVALLDQMEGIAQSTRHRPDAKMRKLIDWIQQNLLHSSSTSNSTSHGNGKWKPVRVLIFSEYLDTVRYIDQQLRNAFAYDENFSDRLANFTGRTRPEIREEIKVAFNGDPERYPLRILLANDAAREGLNLQNHCYHVFHFDLPWNPSRLEQRNGRIDRKLQRSEKVYCHYFHYTQRDADKVLEALVRKTGIIQKQLGSLSRLLDGEIEATLKLGIRKNRITHLVDKLEATSLEETKKKAIEDELLCMQERQEELAGQLDRLRKQLADSQRAANFKEDPFRESLQCALRLLSAPPLHAFETMQGATAYHFPDLQTLDPSWVPAMDGLRPPRPRNIKPADWRREQKLRPIIFKDPGSLDDKAVHLHLEHRVVQRLLGRFTSQGFVYHDLARACIAQSEDALPRVVLLGRLSLYGKGSIRLHEELLAVSARWVEPEKRQEHKGMQPFGDEASRRALRLMEEGLLQPRPVKIPDMVQTRLRSGAMRDVSDLLPTLNEKAQAAALKAIDQLKQRGEAESKAMEKILDEQMQRIQKEFDGHDSSQVGLQTSLFNDDEKRQLEANMRHWQKRLHELENEVQSEPHRILEHYQILSQRIEPIGLAYLWPVTG